MALLFALMLVYLRRGTFSDALSLQGLTIPIRLPMVTAAGTGPIWFGIFLVLMSELGMSTPPACMNVSVVEGTGVDAGAVGGGRRGALPHAGPMPPRPVAPILSPCRASWLARRVMGA